MRLDAEVGANLLEAGSPLIMFEKANYLRKFVACGAK